MEAKEFLVSRIVDEGRRRHVGLSEVERKMLHFSENYPTLPDMMEVAEKFEAQYDDEKYEKKIQRLSRRAFKRDQKESKEKVELWRQAIKALKREDHYLLVMLDVPRSAADLTKLAVAGLVLAAIVVGAILAANWARAHIELRIPDGILAVALILVWALVVFISYRDKEMKLNHWLENLAERVARWF